MLCIFSIMHALVDGICAATMLGQLAPLFPSDIAVLVLLYNLLAFSTQGLTGLLVDKVGRHRALTVLSAALVVSGLLFPANLGWHALFKTALVGLGNSLFHVAAGAKVIKNAPKKAWPLGVFVGPGALGLTLGTLFPWLGGWFAIALSAACVALCLLKAPEPEPSAAEPVIRFAEKEDMLKRVLLSAALLFCVFSRAFGGRAVSFPWKNGALLTIVLTLSVVAGKMLGGVLCDRLGAFKLSAVSVPAAALLMLFCSQWMLPSLLGQFLLNLSMPVTLWLLCVLIPDSPGFAFGLAASCLYPGSLFARSIPDSGAVKTAIIIAVFALNTVLVLLPAAYIAKKRSQTPDAAK